MVTRKLLPMSLGLLLIGAPALAQIEVTPMLGWTYGGNFRDAYYGDAANPITNISVANTAHYGIAVDIPLSREAQFELLYLRQDTDLRYDGAVDPDTPEFDLSINYFHAGFLFQQPYGDWRPYGIFHLGATLFAPKDGDLDNNWRFSWALGLGVKRPISERVAIRLQSRWVGNYITSTSPTWCDPRGFCYGYNSDIIMWQGELTGGVTFLFGGY